MKQNIELLAPAGNFEKLRFALHYGADAVYCSGKAFGLRAFAGNFSNEELAEAIRYTHAQGKKLYVTLNAYPHNAELAGLEEYLAFLESVQPDALLVADPGVYDIAMASGLTVPIHISTQATVVNWAGVHFWEKQQNVERVVLARELSLAEIAEISEKTATELEIFVHGAMCMSYSGRCLLSNYMTGRDANKGECAQPWPLELQPSSRRSAQVCTIRSRRTTTARTFSIPSHLCTLERLPGNSRAAHRAEPEDRRPHEEPLLRVDDHPLLPPCDRRLAGRWRGGRRGASVLDGRAGEGQPSSVHHRFSLRRPEDNAVNNASAGYIKPYDFVGVVRDFDPVSGVATIEQRNKISVGDTIQFFGTDYREHDFTICAMQDENGAPIDSAPHAQQIVKMQLPFSVQPMDLIRKKI